MKKIVSVLVLLAVLLLVLSFRLLSVSEGFAEGTKVAGVDLSGKTAAEARHEIRRVNPRPLVIYLDQKRMTISPEKIGIRPRARQAIARAGQDQPSRLARALGTGQGPEVPLRWSYRPGAIREVLGMIEEQAARSGRPARYRFVGDRLKIARERPGRQLIRRGLFERLHQAADRGGGTVMARTRQERPPVSRSDLLRKSPVVLLVDKSDFQVTVFRDLKAERSFPVAIGMPGFDTPEGWFDIENKSVDPAWLPPDWAGAQAGQLVPGGTPENPLVSRWLGIADGVGIHGTRDTWSLGSAASHGCLRMDPDQVIELYDLVPVGSPILIRA